MVGLTVATDLTIGDSAFRENKVSHWLNKRRKIICAANRIFAVTILQQPTHAMKRLLLFSCCFLLFFSVNAQLVINEVSNGPSGTKEYVELLVTGTPGCGACVNLQGWILDDNNGFFASGTGTGIAQGHMRFSNDPQWACIGVGALIVIYDDTDRNAAIPADDPTDANGDCVYILPASSTLFERSTSNPIVNGSFGYTGPYLPGGDWGTQGMSNTNDSYQVIDPSNTAAPFHAVSYGNNNSNNIIYFSGSGSGRVYSMVNATSDDPYLQANWASGNAGSDETPGSPNNAANSTWISFLNSNCNPGLNITAGPDTSICLGSDSITLNAVGPIGTYTWSTGASGTNNIRVAPVVTTIYTVTVDDGSCTGTASATVTVNDLPLISLAGVDSICPGESTVLTASANPASPSNIFTWSTGAVNTFISTSPLTDSLYSVTVTDANGCSATTDTTVVIKPTPTAIITGNLDVCDGEPTQLTVNPNNNPQWSTGQLTQSITVTNAQDTLFWAEVTNPAGCTDRDTVILNVSPLPIATVTGQDTICAGDSTTLYATGGNSYEWSTGATTDSVRVGPASTTLYSVTVTNTDSCSSVGFYEVAVLASPAATLVGNDTLCLGESTTLTATGGGTYLWSNAETSAAITVSPVANSTYSVTVSLGSCNAVLDTMVMVNPVPTALVTGPPSVCGGDTITLRATGGGTYAWSTGASVDSIRVAPVVASTYTVTVTNSSGCTATASRNVGVDVDPAGVATQDTTICQGSTITLSASSTGDIYLWSTTETSRTIQVSPAATTTYTLTVTSSAGCQSVSDVTVTVSPNNLAATSTVQHVTCGGNDDGQINITVTGGTSPFTYYLSAAGVPLDTSTSSVFGNLEAGTYDVEIRDAVGCNTVLQNIEVLGGPIVNTDVTGTSPACSGDDNGSITVTASGNALTYSLNGGAFGTNTTFSPLAAGDYTVVVADTSGCADTLTYTITEPSAVSVTIDPDSTFIEAGGTAALAALANGGTGNYTYTWSPASFLDCGSCPNVLANPEETTVFLLSVADSNGCVDTASAIVEVNPSFIIEVPSGFTPNGDGFNDFLRPLANEAIDFDLIVFNRWGEKIYEGNGLPGWNGLYKNTEQPIGTYVYYIRYERLSTGEQREIKGSTTLIR